MKNRLLTFILVVITIGLSTAQFNDYRYMRPLDGVNEQWHSLALPDDIYGKISTQMSDIRIIEIEGADTLEVPYLIKNPKPKYEELSFEVINQTSNSTGFYYTFKVEADQPVDQIKVNFERVNFDLRVKLEGSQDQKEWFNILENYRIVSIKNNLTDYQFTTLKFPKTQFEYYRLSVPTGENPNFQSAGMSRRVEADVEYRQYNPIAFDVTENVKKKQTSMIADFEMPVPLSSVSIKVEEVVDYYRSFIIQYLSDSFATEKGWKYNYQTIHRGTLSSLDDNEFRFSTTVAQKLKIIVNNNDNRPLEIKGIMGKGEVRELVVRFEAPGDHYLLYGHENPRKPNYDIKNFQSSIPEDLKPLTLGAEQFILQAQSDTEPLFTNQWWFWALMIGIIGLLGWFSMKMVRG